MEEKESHKTLREYLDDLKNREKYDAWYITKQDLNFNTIIEYVDLLLNFQKNSEDLSLDEYTKKHGKEIIGVDLTSGKRYRALKHGYDYGLLYNIDPSRRGPGYAGADPTNVYKLIKQYQKLAEVEPDYAKNWLNMIKRMQIEKIFISSRYDDEDRRDGKRNFRLFLIPIVYKILIELRKKYDIREITTLQFKSLVSSIQKYDEVDQIVDYVKDTVVVDDTIKSTLEDLRDNFDNRVLNVITQLDTIYTDGKKFGLQDYYLEDTEQKVDKFWKNLDLYRNITDDDYDRLLTNDVELWDWPEVRAFIPANNFIPVNENKRITGGKNVIYYGAPGTGKSHEVDEIVREKYHDENEREKYVFRVTLHPDYEYTDFVGQILPYRLPDNGITYKFVPNIFTLALEKAYENPDKDVYLILEEMSRANVAAVFGDLFQLLDRKEDGSSEYSINNKDIADIVYGDPRHKVTIPSNMTIYGTVNTSDQNVFTMDTAFKRRFEWKYVSTTYGKDNVIVDSKIEIEKGIEVKWTDFYQALNKFIVSDLGLNEDKQIGPFFIKFEKEDSKDVQDGTKTKAHKLVQNKLLQYLWEDVNAAAYDSSKSLFLDKKEIPSFSKLYERFGNGEPIFSKAFKEKLGIKDVEN